MNESDRHTLYGSSFTHVASPTLPIEGIVRDKDTGQPLAGITICAERYLGESVELAPARTDARGHYRLVGLPKGGEASITAVSPNDLPLLSRGRDEPGTAPDDSLPYLPARIAVPKADDKEVLTLDIGLKRGIFVTGRALDKVTGEPVLARVQYLPFKDNPFVKQLPGEFPTLAQGSFATVGSHLTRPDGSFRLIALPGPGVVTTNADMFSDVPRYARGAGLAQSKRVDPNAGWLKSTINGSLLLSHFNTLTEISPAEGMQNFTTNIMLDPGRTLTLNMLDPDGKPLKGAEVAGTTELGSGFGNPIPEATSRSIEHVVAGQNRRIFAIHREKRLVGELVLKGDEESPVSLTLQPWGEVTGRVVDTEGKPWDKPAEVHASPDYLFSFIVGKDGRFRVDGLVPNKKHTYIFMKQHDGNMFGFGGNAFKDISVKPGEVKDLGDVVMKPTK